MVIRSSSLLTPHSFHQPIHRHPVGLSGIRLERHAGRGEAAPDAERFAPYTGILNLVAGGIIVTVIGLVLGAAAPYETWTAIAGSTIWCKFVLDFAIGWHAHRLPPKASAPAPKGP